MTHERNCRTLFINTIRVINLSYTCVNCICNFLSWFPWEGILKKIDIPYHFLFTRNCLVFAYIACNDSKVNFKKKEGIRTKRTKNRSILRYLLQVSLIDFVNSLLVLVNRACEINSTIFEWMRDTRKNKLNRRDLDFYRYFVQIQEEKFKKKKNYETIDHTIHLHISVTNCSKLMAIFQIIAQKTHVKCQWNLYIFIYIHSL